MADIPTPLTQRTSGGPAQQRKERHEEHVSESTASSGVVMGGEPARETAASSADAPRRRGPSEAMERRIQEAIARRQRVSEAAAAVQTTNHDPDILGTYEYLDHTADVQLHSWGESLEEALEQLAVAMFGYMTQLSLINVNEEQCIQHASHIGAQGHDLHSLVFAYLQEWLNVFHETGFVAKQVNIEDLDVEKAFVVHSSGRGEVADWSRHQQGTEVKAITYSNLQVRIEEGKCDVWVIVDI